VTTDDPTRRASPSTNDTERLVEFWSSAPIAFVLLDERFRFVAANPSALALLGMPADQLLGRNLKDVSPSAWQSNRIERYRRVLTEGTAIHIDDVRMDLPSGSRRLSLDVFKVGDFVGATLMDISDLVRHLETALSEKEQQLIHSQKMEAVGRLAGGVAHDFNNILGAMTGYCEMMLEDLDEDDTVRDDVAQMLASCERASSLTSQLLAFSRKQILSPRIVDPNAVVADTHKMLRRLIGEDIELVTLLAPDLGAVEVDPGQLQQVLLNLAVNARDAMPTGGKLVIETRNVADDDADLRALPGARPGPHVLVNVGDTGTGIAPSALEHLFEPFFTTKEAGKGTGLGLSTVYGIVTQSGGVIDVASQPGRGTSFSIYLPRLDQPERPATRPVTTEADLQAAAPATVLVVEDEPMMRLLMTRLLSKAGYRVFEAGHGGEAMAFCERYDGPIDLLLTDVVMPQMGGRRLAEQLTVLRPGIKVLFTSGYTVDAVVRHGVFDHETAFIQKPFTRRDFLATVRQVLGEDRPGRSRPTPDPLP